MTSTMTQKGKVQIICTMPDRYRPQRGYNQATEKLRSTIPSDHLADYYQNKHERSVSKLMNCKSVDKFDYVKGRPDSPKPPKKQLRVLKRTEVQAWLQAGGEIQVDPWKFTRKIVFRNHVQGQCTHADLVAMVKIGVAKPIERPHGYVVYKNVK